MIFKHSNHLGLAAALAAGVFSQACRSKLDVKSKDGGPMPATETPADVPPPEDPGPAPVTDPDPVDPPQKKEVKDVMALKGGKLYFQTRDTITIEIQKAVIEGAPTFSLINVTNSGDDDSKAIEIVKEAVPAFGLHGGFGLAELQGDKIQLQFYPGDAQWKGKFVYGKNKLKVVANDEDNPRFATIELWLQDFDVFGVAVTSFANNVQVAKVDGPNGYQFQGWVNVLSPPTVLASDNSTTLTHGLFNMVNPQ